MPLETPSPGDGSYLQNCTNSSSVIDVPPQGAPSKKVSCADGCASKIAQGNVKLWLIVPYKKKNVKATLWYLVSVYFPSIIFLINIILGINMQTPYIDNLEIF